MKSWYENCDDDDDDDDDDVNDGVGGKESINLMKLKINKPERFIAFAKWSSGIGRGLNGLTASAMALKGRRQSYQTSWISEKIIWLQFYYLHQVLKSGLPQNNIAHIP